MSNQQKRKKPKPAEISIMELLAINRTADSRRLLRKYDMPDATSYEDLHAKLLELYRICPDKKQLEQDLADIHPHKEWIIEKFPAPKEKGIKVEPMRDNKSEMIDDGYYPAEGRDDGRPRNVYHCACGCGGHSNFGGPINNPNKSNGVSNELAIVGILGIVAITAIILHKGKVI